MPTVCGGGRPGRPCSAGSSSIRSPPPGPSQGVSTAPARRSRDGTRCCAGATRPGSPASTPMAFRRTRTCSACSGTTSCSPPRSREKPRATPPRCTRRSLAGGPTWRWRPSPRPAGSSSMPPGGTTGGRWATPSPPRPIWCCARGGACRAARGSSSTATGRASRPARAASSLRPPSRAPTGSRCGWRARTFPGSCPTRSTSTAGWRRSSAPAGPAGRRPRPRRRRSHGPWTRSGTGRPWPPSRTRTRGSIPTCGSRASASRAPPAGSASACASRARTPRRSGARSWTGRGGTCRETRGWSST